MSDKSTIYIGLQYGTYNYLQAKLRLKEVKIRVYIFYSILRRGWYKIKSTKAKRMHGKLGTPRLVFALLVFIKILRIRSNKISSTCDFSANIHLSMFNKTLKKPLLERITH